MRDAWNWGGPVAVSRVVPMPGWKVGTVSGRTQITDLILLDGLPRVLKEGEGA